MAGTTSDVFTNPAGAAREAGARYTAALLELLGDRDPVTVMQELPTRLQELIEGVPPDALRRPERSGKWSVVQVLWHLADSEMIYFYRMRLIVAQPGVTVPGYDQDAWADRLHYADGDVDAALELIAFLRPRTLRWVSSLTDEERAREGAHEERGAESVSHVLRMLAAHDLLHRRQIRRILDAVAG